MMFINKIKGKLKNYPKTFGLVGFVVTSGLIYYERRKLTKLIDQLAEAANKDNEKQKRPEYIYIKYHIYKESMRLLKQQEEDEKKWINIIVNPIGKWWKSIKHSIAWRLLNIAQNGDHRERLKAVWQLVHVDHLKDWDYRHLAQICDGRTAVSLARCGADLRWFLPAHMCGCVKNPKIILAQLHNLLAHLRSRDCVRHFFAKYFPEPDPVDDLCELLSPEQIASSISSKDLDLLKEVISFLYHITKDPVISKQILEDGGLVQLMELRKIFNNDNETLSILCKVLANISLVEDCVEHFYVTGWVGTLATWQKSPDLRLQVISAKAMANLDHDDPNYTTYHPNVYPLHPRKRANCKPKADIILIHGLLGGVFITWRQKDRKCSEIGLYGKNAFYATDSDDLCLVGERKKAKSPNDTTKQSPKTDKPDAKLLPIQKQESKSVNISNPDMKEIVECLRNEAELDAEWEVVLPDVPLWATENAIGPFSIAGSEWENPDDKNDYTYCWPMEWLPDDYPNARIIGVDYSSAVTEWSQNFSNYCPCEKLQGHLDIRAANLLDRILKSNVGNNAPIIWIGHSMGGLLTKSILMKALDSNNPKAYDLVKNTSSIVFLGTPHRGSAIAKMKQSVQLILSPSIEVKEMEENSPKLLELHDSFMNALNSSYSHVKVVSIAEGVPTMLTSFKFPLHIVTEDSARIDYGDFYILRDDHLGLSKPRFRQSFLYQRLLKTIEESLERAKKTSGEEDTITTELSPILPETPSPFTDIFGEFYGFLHGFAHKIWSS